MTELWVATIGASLACYLLKFLGYTIPEHWLTKPRVQRITELIPVVLLGALIAVQTFISGQQLTIDNRFAGVLAAAIALKLRLSFPVMMLTAALTSALVYNFLL